MLPQVDVTETKGLLRGDLYVRPGGQSTNLHPPQAQHTRTHLTRTHLRYNPHRAVGEPLEGRCHCRGGGAAACLCRRGRRLKGARERLVERCSH